MALKIFLDDKRKSPDPALNYNCVRTYQNCILLLSAFKEVEVINLDYDLGDTKTGYDVLVYMHDHNIYPKVIIIHSTHQEGVRLMENYIKEYFKDAICQYSPMSE